MQRRYYSIWILLLTICIIVLAYFAYNRYLRPIYRNYTQQEQQIDFSGNRSLSFGKHKQQKGIFSIELEIEGQASANVRLHIANGDAVMHQASLKGNPMRFEYMGDWYDDSCHLYFDGPDDLEGKALVSLRFLSIE